MGGFSRAEVGPRPSRQRLRRPAAVALAIGSVMLSAPDTAAQVGQERLRRSIQALEAVGLRVGFQAVLVDDKQAVVAHRAAEEFVPASNQKLWTAAAALELLGADFEFRTGFALRGGRLLVRPGGDPNWRRDGDYSPHRFLSEVEAILARAGVRRLAGVEVETTGFGPVARGPAWPVGQDHLDYCAPNGPLLFDGAAYELEFAPTRAGEPALVTCLSQTGAFVIENGLMTTADRKLGGRYRVEERSGVLRVHGAFWAKNSARVVRGAVADPTAAVVRAIEARLRAAGITFEPSAREPDRELGELRTPLLPALRRALVDSSNIDAEQLLRVIGYERRGDGRAGVGLELLERSLRELLGSAMQGVRLADGSGLSRDNRATPSALAALLVEVARRPYAATFAAALAEGGRSGTLANRFADGDLRGRVRAKTGTLAGVSALSGYFRTRDGKVMAFALLVDRARARAGAPPMRQIEVDLLGCLDEGSQ
jgi:D-alanyl-D-alanine carboxypeptidase/D-alanyl-D-alanine-endopeptidase (penicillin-binding protein 4)